MSWSWLATFGAGVICGAVILGVAQRFHQLDRDTAKYWAGVEDERAGIAPLRPVADLPSERGAIHPAMGGLLVAGLFLVAGYTVGPW